LLSKNLIILAVLNNIGVKKFVNEFTHINICNLKTDFPLPLYILMDYRFLYRVCPRSNSVTTIKGLNKKK